MIALPIVAVVAAPILPDLWVSMFGETRSARDFWVRASSILVLLLFLLGTYIWWAWRESRRRDQLFREDIEPCDILVLPLGFGSKYAARSGNTRAPRTIPEWLIDKTGPSVVLLVATPEVRERLDCDGMVAELAVDNICGHVIEISTGKDPALVATDVVSKVMPKVQIALRTNDKCYIDTTGGTVPLSLAMLRLAAELQLECVYVSSDFDKTHGGIRAGSQRPHRYYPAAVTKGAA